MFAVYPSLDLSDNEEESMSRVVEKRDESWNPGGMSVVGVILLAFVGP